MYNETMAMRSRNDIADNTAGHFGASTSYPGNPARDASVVESALNSLHGAIVDSQHAVAELGSRLVPVSQGRNHPDSPKVGSSNDGAPAMCKVEEQINDATVLIRMLHSELVLLREALCI